MSSSAQHSSCSSSVRRIIRLMTSLHYLSVCRLVQLSNVSCKRPVLASHPIDFTFIACRIPSTTERSRLLFQLHLSSVTAFKTNQTTRACVFVGVILDAVSHCPRGRPVSSLQIISAIRSLKGCLMQNDSKGIVAINEL